MSISPTYPFQRAQRSSVWQPEYCARTAAKEVKCQQRGKVFMYHGSISTMQEHLKRAHSSLLRETTEVDSSTFPISKFFPASSLEASSFASRACSAAMAKRITDLIVDWVAGDLRPLIVVHDNGFL